jgi:hypothetical protein
MSQELTQAQTGEVQGNPTQELNTQSVVENIIPENQGEDTKIEGEDLSKAVEDVQTNGQSTEGNVQTQPTQQDVDALNQRLKEYELKDTERKAIADRLGVDESKADMLGLYSLEAQIENQANSAFIRICNDFGVDAAPENMEKSLKQLQDTDPKRYYEFMDRAKNINNELNYKRQEISRANYNYGVNKFAQENKQLVENIPAFANVIREYCNANMGNPNIYAELNSITEMAISLIQSGMELGHAYSLQQKAKTDTTSVSGGIATSQNPTYTSDKIWSRGEISKLSTEEFSKYEKQIMQAYAEGRIQD